MFTSCLELLSGSLCPGCQQRQPSTRSCLTPRRCPSLTVCTLNCHIATSPCSFCLPDKTWLLTDCCMPTGATTNKAMSKCPQTQNLNEFNNQNWDVVIIFSSLFLWNRHNHQQGHVQGVGAAQEEAQPGGCHGGGPAACAHPLHPHRPLPRQADLHHRA